MKAIKSTEPPWFRSAKQLEYLLSGAWEKVSKDYLEEILSALNSKDLSALEKLVEMVESLGPEMEKAFGDKPEAILKTLQSKANAAWTLHGKEVMGLRRITNYDGDYQEFLTHISSEQVKAFAVANPKRILHEQLVRQLEYLQQTDLTRAIDMGQIGERLTRIVKQQQYFENLSDAAVSRLWHSDGLLMASENKIKSCYIVGPNDNLCCNVCLHVLGLEVKVSLAVEKIKGGLEITEPSKYAEYWKFPRIQDVDNQSREELATKNISVPLHPRCRHSYAWLYR